MSLNRTRGRIKSWFPGRFPSAALNRWRRCICQSWWPGLKNVSEITLQLYDGEQHELMHGLHRGRFDLALVYDLELGHSINKERLNAPHKPYALLPAAHPLAQKAQVTLQELSREPMILLDAVPAKIILSPSLRKRAITRKWPTVHPPSKWCAVWWVRGWVFRYWSPGPVRYDL
jgi:hypothetical protein